MFDLVLKWLPIAVSLLALTVTATFSWTSQVDRRTAARLAREKDLHGWARDIGDVYVVLRTGDDAERRKAVARLSVQIDFGRLFFPNERTAREVTANQKGRRSSVLDPLVETRERCLGGNWDEHKLMADWRQFTNQLSSRTTAFAIDTSPEAEGIQQYRNP
jgi:acylphosphatase